MVEVSSSNLLSPTTELSNKIKGLHLFVSPFFCVPFLFQTSQILGAGLVFFKGILLVLNR